MEEDYKGITLSARSPETTSRTGPSIPCPSTISRALTFKAGTLSQGPALPATAASTYSKVAGTFLDMRGWNKGNAWVNGHHLGRFWNIGPQQTLYVPPSWLHEGRNDIVVLEMQPGWYPCIAGARRTPYSAAPRSNRNDIAAVLQAWQDGSRTHGFRGRKRGMEKAGRYLGYMVTCLALPVAQVVVPPLTGRELPELAYYLMLFASGAACLAALVCLRVPTYERRTMVCLALGLACWFVGMAYAIARSGTDENLISTYVLFVSYGVPLLYAAVSTRDEPSMLSRRIVDGSLLILVVILCYLGVRDLRDANGFLKNEDMVWVVIAFDVENVFLFHHLRWSRSLTATEEREHRFFRLTTAFLAFYAIAAGIHNHDELHPNLPIFQQLADVLPTVPFMALVCLLHAQRHGRPFEPTRHRWARQLSMSLAPGLLLAAIFALSLGIRETQRTFGRVVLALADACLCRPRDADPVLVRAHTRHVVRSPRSGGTRIATGRTDRHPQPSRLRSGLRRAHEGSGTRRQATERADDRRGSVQDVQRHAWSPRGDVALRAVARLLAGTLRRPTDFIARYGGEEFVALLPGADRLGAQVVARRMNRAVYDAQLEHAHGIDGRVTVSIGVATGLATRCAEPGTRSGPGPVCREGLRA